MDTLSTDNPENPPVFGSTKREILLILKRNGQTDLKSLAERLRISKMASTNTRRREYSVDFDIDVFVLDLEVVSSQSHGRGWCNGLSSG